MMITARSEQRDERLSALMDGEIHDNEIDQSLRDLKQDSELRARWDRYHLASDSWRSDLSPHIDTALADRISAAIEAEPVYVAPQHWRRNRTPQWLRQAGGLAIAASVTAVTILGTQALVNSPAAPGSAQIASSAPRPAAAMLSNPAGTRIPPEGIELATYRDHTTATSANPPAAPWARLDNLLLNHQEYQAKHTLQGTTLPYVRLVNSQQVR